MTLRSPVSGAPLHEDTPHSLCEPDGRRWAVVDGIPFLRTGRDDLAREALACLDRGDEAGALAELLRDADDWWNEPPPDRAALRELIADRDRLSLREAMAGLGFGRVGDYFAHRWTDPTFLAGLGLLQAHWNAPVAALELACGIGHYLRVLRDHGVAVTGGDVVWAKLWIARHFVVGAEAKLVCFDAAAPWPLADMRFDLVLCQDAFYFLEPKPTILAKLRGTLASGGALLVGHVHNREATNHSAGAALTAGEAAALFPNALAYDDAELTRAVAEGRTPLSRPLSDLRAAEAFALAETAGAAPISLSPSSSSPRLRRNPLYRQTGDRWTIAWPSSRYQAEYAALATFPPEDDSAGPTPENVRRRVFVELPERW